MKPVDPELGLVERSDLVRGYQYEDDQYVIIEDATSRRCASSRTTP
jgi:DNA end-binding protein Ku